MAGFYPDVPAARMAYDRDGSAGFTTAGSITTALSGANLVTLNDESSDYIDTPGGGAVYGILFPELRDLVAYYADWDPLADAWVGTIETSANTTNGVDGTWTTQTGPSVYTETVVPGYRTHITTLSVAGINAIRFTFTQVTGPAHDSKLYSIHLFGPVASGQNPDRLRFWHPTLNQELGAAAFDWGDVAVSGTADFTFRLKNNSGTLTAHTITVSTEALTDTTPTTVSQHTFSDGGAFGSTVGVTSIAPGAISGVLTMRRTTPSNAALGVWALRAVAVAANWT